MRWDIVSHAARQNTHFWIARSWDVHCTYMNWLVLKLQESLIRSSKRPFRPIYVQAFGKDIIQSRIYGQERLSRFPCISAANFWIDTIMNKMFTGRSRPDLKQAKRRYLDASGEVCREKWLVMPVIQDGSRHDKSASDWLHYCSLHSN